MYQYLFSHKYFEYYQEKPEREEIIEKFYERSGISKSEKVIDIRIAPFVRYIK